MGKVRKILGGSASKPKTIDYAAQQAAAKAKADAAANATLADQRRRQRTQQGLLTTEDTASTVLSSAGQRQAGANTTANATVLGSGGK